MIDTTLIAFYFQDLVAFFFLCVLEVSLKNPKQTV